MESFFERSILSATFYSPIFPSLGDSSYSYEGKNFVLINRVLAQKNILGSTKCLNTRAHGNRACSQQTEG